MMKKQERPEHQARRALSRQTMLHLDRIMHSDDDMAILAVVNMIALIANRLNRSPEYTKETYGKGSDRSMKTSNRAKAAAPNGRKL